MIFEYLLRIFLYTRIFEEEYILARVWIYLFVTEEIDEIEEQNLGKKEQIRKKVGKSKKASALFLT